MDEHPSSDRSMSPDAPAADAPRSRRSILAMGLGGLAGAVAATMAQAVPAAAAPGSALIIGVANAGGAATTSLKSSSAIAALKVTDTSTASAASAIRAIASRTTGNVYGVNASTVSGGTSSAGVNGMATAGQGVQGFATGTSGYGVLGSATGTSGKGVVGTAQGPSGLGVQGVSASYHGTTGTTYGSGADTAGVRGEALGTAAANVHGVYGSTANGGPGAAGVKGYATNNLANAMVATGLNGAYGILASSSSYAVFSSGHAYVLGNATVTGTLTKGAGAFRIDHPLDPERRYLQHSFVESPEMKNVYDGVATLGTNGSVTVRLPRWFEALNRDFRYQLTAIGSAAPGLFIKQGVEGNRFVIAGGAPGQRVSWQVTGIRHDAYARAHPIRVEVAKRGDEVGRLLHAKELGHPAGRRIDPAATRLRAARRRPRAVAGIRQVAPPDASE